MKKNVELIEKSIIFAPSNNKKVVIMETLKKHPVHYRVAFCNEIFPTLTAAKHYVYINYTPQEQPFMHDTYITGHSADGEPVTFTRVFASRSIFKFEKPFSCYGNKQC